MDVQTPYPLLDVDTTRIQYVAVIGSILLLLFIFELTRKGAIRIPYSLLWFTLSLIFLVVSIWRDILETCSRFFGVAYAPAALFLVLIIGIIGILIHFSIVLSSLSERTRILVQEISIIQLKLQRLSSLRDVSTTNDGIPDEPSK